jgi:hypothetical protein
MLLYNWTLFCQKLSSFAEADALHFFLKFFFNTTMCFKPLQIFQHDYNIFLQIYPFYMPERAYYVISGIYCYTPWRPSVCPSVQTRASLWGLVNCSYQSYIMGFSFVISFVFLTPQCRK